MIIDITSRHVSVTDDIKEHAERRLGQILRHVGELVSAHVVLDEEKERSTAEMVVHGRHLTAAVHAEAGDFRTAIDRATAKIRHQLERHHSRTLGRRRVGRRHVARDEAREAAELAAVEAATSAARAARRRAKDDETLAPKVVRLSIRKLKSLTVDQAAAEVTRGDDGFLVFRNSDSDRIGVLYRRGDGNLSLVEAGTA
jgi:putative sigma-54 modulation protein